MSNDENLHQMMPVQRWEGVKNCNIQMRLDRLLDVAQHIKNVRGDPSGEEEQAASERGAEVRLVRMGVYQCGEDHWCGLRLRCEAAADCMFYCEGPGRRRSSTRARGSPRRGDRVRAPRTPFSFGDLPENIYATC